MISVTALEGSIRPLRTTSSRDSCKTALSKSGNWVGFCAFSQAYMVNSDQKEGIGRAYMVNSDPERRHQLTGSVTDCCYLSPVCFEAWQLPLQVP